MVSPSLSMITLFDVLNHARVRAYKSHATKLHAWWRIRSVLRFTAILTFTQMKVKVQRLMVDVIFHLQRQITSDHLFSVDTSCICRWFCGPHRQFQLEFFTPQDDLVFTLFRKSCRCDWCCCLDCVLCNHKVYVVDCLNRTLGSIKQK